MGNYKIKINLLRLQGAFVTTLKGKTSAKRCLCIPIDDAHLFLGEKGCYLDANAWEMRDPNAFGASHYIKQRFTKEVHNALTEEQRRAIPILGDMSPRQEYSADGVPVPQPATQPPQAVESEDELPF